MEESEIIKCKKSNNLSASNLHTLMPYHENPYVNRFGHLGFYGQRPERERYPLPKIYECATKITKTAHNEQTERKESTKNACQIAIVAHMK